MNIVAIGAHPDDVEFHCAGTLAKHVEYGDDVLIVVVSNGETIDHNNNMIRKAKVSVEEACAGAEAIGAKIKILGYTTLEIPYSRELVGELNQIIDDFGADIVYTHWNGHSHQDHRNVSLSTLAATRHVKDVLMWEDDLPHSPSCSAFRPQFYVDISGQIDKKINSIRAHESQMRKYTPELEDAIVARARFRGYQIRVKYAETFEVVRIVNNGVLREE